MPARYHSLRTFSHFKDQFAATHDVGMTQDEAIQGPPVQCDGPYIPEIGTPGSVQMRLAEPNDPRIGILISRTVGPAVRSRVRTWLNKSKRLRRTRKAVPETIRPYQPIHKCGIHPKIGLAAEMAFIRKLYIDRLRR